MMIVRGELNNTALYDKAAQLGDEVVRKIKR